MTTAYLDPNVAVNALWIDSTVTKIDDASRNPTAPGTGEYCKADKNDLYEEQIWGFSGSSLTNINITQIKLICYGLSTGSEGADARVKVNSTWQTATFVLNSSSNAFYELTWNGTWNGQNANNLQMGFASLAVTDEVHIEEAYLLITYTAAAGGGITKHAMHYARLRDE